MLTDPLLPAEAVLLIEPRRSAAPLCIQATLLTLLGRGYIAIEEEGKLLRRRTLRLLPVRAELLPGHLAAIRNALEAPARAGRLGASEVVRALQKSFGNDYRHFVHDILAPSLVGRGLLIREERAWLGIFPYVQYRRTTSGEIAARPLIKLIAEAGGIKKLLRTDPDRAIAIVRAAGILLVMSPAARKQLPKLKNLLAERSDGGCGDGFYISGGDDETEQWEIGIDVGLGVLGELDGWIDSIGAIGDFTGGDGGGDGGDGGGGD